MPSQMEHDATMGVVGDGRNTSFFSSPGFFSALAVRWPKFGPSQPSNIEIRRVKVYLADRAANDDRLSQKQGVPPSV